MGRARLRAFEAPAASGRVAGAVSLPHLRPPNYPFLRAMHARCQRPPAMAAWGQPEALL